MKHYECKANSVFKASSGSTWHLNVLHELFTQFVFTSVIPPPSQNKTPFLALADSSKPVPVALRKVLYLVCQKTYKPGHLVNEK